MDASTANAAGSSATKHTPNAVTAGRKAFNASTHRSKAHLSLDSHLCLRRRLKHLAPVRAQIRWDSQIHGSRPRSTKMMFPVTVSSSKAIIDRTSSISYITS